MALTKIDDERKACAWRADTVRLHRACMGVPALELQPERIDSEYLQAFCASTAMRMLNDLRPQLREDLSPDVTMPKPFAELRLICTDAALLALEVFSQKSNFGILAHKALCAIPFSAASEMHATHMCMGHEDDDNSLDGEDVQLILVPAMAVWGDADGENLHFRKIVSKSVIYMKRDWLPNVLSLHHAEYRHACVGPVLDSSSANATSRSGADDQPMTPQQRKGNESSESVRKRRKLENHQFTSDLSNPANVSTTNIHSSGTLSNRTPAASNQEDRLDNPETTSPSTRFIFLDRDLQLEDRSKPLLTTERSQITKGPGHKKALFEGAAPSRRKFSGDG